MKTIKAEMRLLDMKTDVAECINLRRDDKEGVLRGVRDSELVGTLSGPVAFTDTMERDTMIFTVAAGGALMLDARVSGTTVEKIGKVIGYPSAAIESAAKAGEFIVLRLCDGELEFLRRDSLRGEYTWLGKMPEMPAVKVERTAGPRFSVSIPAVKLGSRIDDPRGTLSSEAMRPVADAVRKAYEEARDAALAAGYFSSGVAVRFALRLWDGELLALSDPVLPAGAEEHLPDPVALTPVMESGAITTTEQATLDLDTYGIRIAVPGTVPEQWHGVVRQLEVWFSLQAGSTRSRQVNVSYNAASGRFVARFSDDSPYMTADTVLTGEMCLAGRFLLSQLPLEPTDMKATDSGPFFAGVENTAIARGVRAGAIAGHGGFLHIGSLSEPVPPPPIPFREDPQGAGECRVTIVFDDGRNLSMTERTARVDAPDAVMQAMIWYPLPDALTVTVALRDNAGNLYESTMVMCDAQQWNASFWHSSSGPSALKAVDKWSVTDYPPARRRAFPGRVLTMKRGNPFSVSSMTADCGAAVRHILAQGVGGGAYTRQYVYLFTDDGVYALTHDNSGRHRTCRPVSARTVRSSRQIAVTPQGVWMVSSSGELLCIRDSGLDLFSQNISPDAELTLDACHGELLVADRETDEAVVISMARRPVDPLPFWTRSLASGSCYFSSPGALLEIDKDCGLRICESKNAPVMSVFWVTVPVEIDISGPGLVLFRGDGSDMEMWMRYVRPGRQGYGLLAKAKMDGECRFSVMFPETKTRYGYIRPSRVSFEINGMCTEFSGIDLI